VTMTRIADSAGFRDADAAMAYSKRTPQKSSGPGQTRRLTGTAWARDL
jgi:hypothetical protein